VTDRLTIDQINSDQLDALYDEIDRLTAELADYDRRVQHLIRELTALRAVARGYCPACGRGDAAPTVADWEQQKQRADQAEAALARVHALAEEYPAGIDTTLIHAALDQEQK
jgi:hypothetical protein